MCRIITYATLLIFMPFLPAFSQNPLSVFEKSNGLESANYQEILDFYEQLSASYPNCSLVQAGLTDAGKPLRLFILSDSGKFDPEAWQKEGKVVILINNGIHPGEPEGIDASMLLARDILSKPELTGLLKKVVLCIIPVYNIGGCLNRGSFSRANQNGPQAYGFRGNYQNLDLNRDFIKADSKNTQSFYSLFHTINPAVFIDNHTSNGADYQYVLTYIATQKDKLNPALARYQQHSFIPSLERALYAAGTAVSPYVNTLSSIPDSGISAFLETPRYSTGYTALFNTLGFVVETHMLKPYQQRVEATYGFMISCLHLLYADAELVLKARNKAIEETINQRQFSLSWSLDSSRYTYIPFKGYEAGYKPSEVSGQNRLFYDRLSPYEKEIKYYNSYKADLSTEKPFAYIVPQAFDKVIGLLKLNNIRMQQLSKDTSLEVESYYIDDMATVHYPYEGHYLHSRVTVSKRMQTRNFLKGDYVIYVNQPGNRYLVESLEPQAVDAFFAWNFFDACLGQKEYFSDYVFEDIAAQLLEENKELKRLFDEKKAADKEFANNAEAQLGFIYKHSPYYELSHKRYPVARLHSLKSLPLQ